MTYTLKLRAPGNPDFGQYAPIAPAQNVRINRIEDAPDIVGQYIHNYNLGGGNWGDGAGEILDEQDVVVARCTYNGSIVYPSQQTFSPEWIDTTINRLQQSLLARLGSQWKTVRAGILQREDGLQLSCYFSVDPFDPRQYSNRFHATCYHPVLTQYIERFPSLETLFDLDRENKVLSQVVELVCSFEQTMKQAQEVLEMETNWVEAVTIKGTNIAAQMMQNPQSLFNASELTFHDDKSSLVLKIRPKLGRNSIRFDNVSDCQFQAILTALEQHSSAVVISKHLPNEIAKRTQYSLDFTLYLQVEDLTLLNGLTAESFNPNNANVIFRTMELQHLGGSAKVFYLDGIWALDADSPVAAESTVDAGLKSIPIPSGVTLLSAEIGCDGEGTVYDNRQGIWID